MYWTTLTQKGQVTIPKVIRDQLGLKPRQKVSFELTGDAATITKPPTLAEIRESFRGSPVWPGDQVADANILKYVAKEYAQKQKRSRH